MWSLVLIPLGVILVGAIAARLINRGETKPDPEEDEWWRSIK